MINLNKNKIIQVFFLYFKKQINYLLSLKRFILISFLIFSLSVLYGYFFALFLPSQADLIIKNFQESFSSLIELSSFFQFLIIFLNNTLVAFLAVFLGLIIGVFPFLVLFLNGTLLGVMIYFSKVNISLFAFIALVLPHGIIEIPVIIISCAVGFNLGVVFLRELRNKFNKEKRNPGQLKIIKKEAINAFSFFLTIIIPFLLLAAAIEAFITARFISFF